MSIVTDRSGDCVITRLDDGRLSVTQADPIIDVSTALFESERSEHVAWNGFLLAIDAVEGVVMYRALERVNIWGCDYTRMERVA